MGKKERQQQYNIKRQDMENAFQMYQDQFENGDALSKIVSSLMDRSYYDMAGDPRSWNFPERSQSTPMHWLRIEQLPTGQDEEKDTYRPKERMQGMISAAHTLKQKVAFVLTRERSYTNLYLGTYAAGMGEEAANQLRQLAQINLNGVAIEKVDGRQVENAIGIMNNCGMLTGQPSIRWDERENPLQSLDKLTRGLRNNSTGTERDYAVVIIAEPINEREIKDVLIRVQDLKTSLHEYVKMSESRGLNQGANKGENSGNSVGVSDQMIAGIIGGIMGLTTTALCVGAGLGPLALPLGSMANKGAQALVGAVLKISLSHYGGTSYSENTGISGNVSHEHINSMMQYCIGLLDDMVKRLEQGRNLGFWNTSTYVLGDSISTVDIVNATLRSIYSGQDTHQEPLRAFNFGQSSVIHKYIMGMQLLPLPVAENARELAEVIAAESGHEGDGWHIFGHLYESMSTPVNTEELSVLMSLPRKDVAGLHIKKNAVDFAISPHENYGARSIRFGEILDMGTPTGHTYYLDLDQLNRHGMIPGLNGGGKSVSSRSILSGMMEYNIPFMVIDPVKTDYVEWADEMNRLHAGEEGYRPIAIYAPGLNHFPGIETELSTLKMNPFQPYAAKGAPLNIQGHTDAILGLLNRTMAMGDFLPILLEEAVYNYTEAELKEAAWGTEVDPGSIQHFPKLSGLRRYVSELLEERQYSEENTRNFNAAIETRLNSLTRGWKENFFEADRSTPAEELFERNVVICLAGVTNNNDKSFLMSMLLQAMSEYRISCYQYDREYREHVKQWRSEHNGNCLCHYTVIEEAHRILQVPSNANYDANPQALAAEKFCEMLSEIREPGEGLMIIDQYPSRLIPDAIKNTNFKLVHRLLAADDRNAMASCMALTNSQSQLLAMLKKGDAIIGSEQDESAMWLHVYLNKNHG